MRPIMSKVTIALPAAARHTTSRLPPFMRSITGPMSGDTTANGAKLSARKRTTFPRAASGLIDKNRELASATVIAASPAVIRTWVLASEKNNGRAGSPIDPALLDGRPLLTLP